MYRKPYTFLQQWWFWQMRASPIFVIWMEISFDWDIYYRLSVSFHYIQPDGGMKWTNPLVEIKHHTSYLISRLCKQKKGEEHDSFFSSKCIGLRWWFLFIYCRNSNNIQEEIPFWVKRQRFVSTRARKERIRKVGDGRTWYHYPTEDVSTTRYDVISFSDSYSWNVVFPNRRVGWAFLG